MKKNSLLLLFILITAITHSQRNKVCKSDEVIVESLNEIHKCAAETKKSTSLNKEDTELVTHKARVANRYFIKRKNKTTTQKLSLPKVRKKEKVLKVSTLNCAGVIKVKAKDVSKSISAKDLATYLAEKKYVKFEEVEEIPLFESCNTNKEDKLVCFNTNMANYIADNFEYDDETISENKIENVTISFVIDTSGKVTNIKTKGYKQATELHNDLVKLIENLPTFIPAKNNGEKVSVKYKFEMNLSL